MTQQHWTRRVLGSLVLTVAMWLTPWMASAQDTDRSSFLVDIAKDVVLVPTTYAPSIIAHHATRRDRMTSHSISQTFPLSPRLSARAHASGTI